MPPFPTPLAWLGPFFLHRWPEIHWIYVHLENDGKLEFISIDWSQIRGTYSNFIYLQCTYVVKRKIRLFTFIQVNIDHKRVPFMTFYQLVCLSVPSLINWEDEHLKALKMFFFILLVSFMFLLKWNPPVTEYD